MNLERETQLVLALVTLRYRILRAKLTLGPASLITLIPFSPRLRHSLETCLLMNGLVPGETTLAQVGVLPREEFLRTRQFGLVGLHELGLALMLAGLRCWPDVEGFIRRKGTLVPVAGEEAETIPRPIAGLLLRH